MAHLTDPKMKACVEACNQCYQMCLHEAMNHCLETGGDHRSNSVPVQCR